MCDQILPASTIRNIWRTVRRTCMLILGLKGIITVTLTSGAQQVSTVVPTNGGNHISPLLLTSKNLL